MPFDDIPLSMIALVAVFFAVALIETILSLRWVPLYMRSGIPVWQQTKPILKDQFEKAATRMDDTEMPDKSYFTIVFKQISPYNVAFQNKSGEIDIGFRRRMTIRGILKFDKRQNSVKVVTYFPWFMLLILISPMAFGQDYFQELLGGNNWTILVFSLLLIAVFIGWQIKSLRKINERILKRFIEESHSE